MSAAHKVMEDSSERPLASVIGSLKSMNYAMLREYLAVIEDPKKYAELHLRYRDVSIEINVCRKEYNKAFDILFPPVKYTGGEDLSYTGGDDLIPRLQKILHTEFACHPDINLLEIGEKLQVITDICFPMKQWAGESRHDEIGREESNVTQLALAVHACAMDRPGKKMKSLGKEEEISAPTEVANKSDITSRHLEWLSYKVEQIGFWYAMQGGFKKEHSQDIKLLLSVIDETIKDSHTDPEKKFFMIAKQIKTLWNQGMHKYKDKVNGDIEMVKFLNENLSKHSFLRDVGALLQECGKICAQCNIANTLRQRE